VAPAFTIFKGLQLLPVAGLFLWIIYPLRQTNLIQAIEAF